jgi:hypothetical protein
LEEFEAPITARFHSRPTRPFRILSATILVLGVSGLVFSWWALPPHNWIPVAILLLAALLSENYALELPTYTISLAYPLGMAAMILDGPTSAAIIASLTAVSIADIRNRTEPSVMGFNIGQLLIVPLIGGWCYLFLGGPLLLTQPRPEWLTTPLVSFPIWPLIVAATICALGNVIATSLAISNLGEKSLRSVVWSLVWVVPSQLALALVGFLMAQVIAISWVALPLFVAPLLVARQLYQRYAALKEAYADTVRSLIGALEAKDPYTRGHSERVAEYALRLGAAVGLDSRTLEQLEYAALLHDLGKLAVPGSLLTKPGSLTDTEMDLIRLHPARGAEMVAKIPPLKDLAVLVGNHHEWYGGGGYPLEKKTPAIPQLALILCVADSYDAMTTTRSYRAALTREEAIAQLVSGAGSQFDPELVESFIEGRVGEPLTAGDSPIEASASALPVPTQGGRV